MKIIKKYTQFVNESKEESTKLIIPKGEEFFHGTVEDFDIKDIRTGGYDGIFWTSEDPAIAQTYIPVAGSSMVTKTEHFHAPQYHESDRAMQRQLGINYDYDRIEFAENRRPLSWSAPPEWKEESDKAHLWSEKHMELGKKMRAKRDEYNKMNHEFAENYETIKGDERTEWKTKQVEFYKELHDMEEEYDIQSKEYHDKGSSKKFEYEFINNALKKLGYKPDTNYPSDNNYTWKLKMGFDKGKNQVIYPANYRAEGRLIIIRAKEDLKIYDLTMGGSTEGDLTDLDYHKIDLFRRVEKDGYDGIKINDFAQIESEGNFGHDSIGFFESTIPKLDIVSIPATHPENFGNNHLKTGDYQTKEYKAYKESN